MTGRMKDLKDRYGPYPKKKGKRGNRFKEEHFLKRSFDWLKWKVTDLSSVRSPTGIA